MKEKNKEHIIEKIIKEQDMIALYTVSYYNKSIGVLEKYDDEISYIGLKNFIVENPSIVDSFSTKNLYTLIASIFEKQETKAVLEKIHQRFRERLEVEDFFVEDIDTEAFLRPIHTYNSYGHIPEDLREKINEKLLTNLEELKSSECSEIAVNLQTYSDLANFYKYYKDGVFTPDKIQTILGMINKNPNSLNYVNFGLFQDEIYEIGPEFCEYMSKFPTISYQLISLKNHNTKLFSAVADRIKTYDNLKDNLGEIEVLITYAAKNMFELENEEINIDDFLECAYKSSSEFGVIKVKYETEYSKRLEEKLVKEYKKAFSMKQKLNLYMNKVFSISLEKAKGLLKDFGSDLENMQNISEETKNFFAELENAIKMQDEKEIDELFYSSNIKYSATKIQEIKRSISGECAKEFAKEFQSTDEAIKQKLQENNEEDVKEIEYNGKKIKQVKLNGKFNILFHSTDTNFIRKQDKTEDFKSKWANGDDKKNHIISTAYANQDLFGVAPVGTKGIRCAILTVNYSDIRLMGVSDLNTYSSEFAYDSLRKQYMSAKSLAYNARRVYSEFGIEREGIIPDYIVILDDDSPEVIENSYKAAAQFDIPILYVDKAEIEQAQIQNLESLLDEFKSTKNTNVLQRLINTYETNMAGWLLNRSEGIERDESHTSSIDNTRFMDDFKNIQTKIEDEIKLFLSEEKEVKTGNEAYEVINILLHEIELYEGCEETTPISKTKISLNIIDLLKHANQSLEEAEKQEWKVDLENIPTSKEYKIKIQDIIKNALSGEKSVNIEDYRRSKEIFGGTYSN